MNVKQLMFVVLCASSLTAQAGVYVEFVKRDAASNKEEGLQKMWVQNGMARIESTGKRASVAIFKNNALQIVDESSKSYQTVDKETMAQTARLMDDAMAKLPPDQRAMVEQMMKQRGGAAAAGQASKTAVYDAKPTGSSDTVDGKSCKVWNVTRNGAPSQQLCVVPLSALPGADEVVAVSKKMSELFESFGERMREMMGNDMQASSATFTKINGYPLMIRTYREGKLSPEAIVIKNWNQQSVDAAKFEIPAGYKKQEMRMPQAN